jgi:hypothetical protein
MMLRTVVAIAAVTTPGSGFAAQSVAAAGGCFPQRSVTLATSRTARVFEIRRSNGSTQGTYGCLFAYGKPRLLDHSTYERLVEAGKPFRLAGSLLAFPRHVSQFGDGDTQYDWTEVVVADLRPSRPLILHKHFAASDETLRQFRDPDAESYDAEAFVTDLVVRRSGAVGWIECPGVWIGPCAQKALPYDDPAWTSVFAASPGRRVRSKLDEGSAIGRRSLTWSGGRLRWTNGGRSRSAALG